MVKSLTAQQQCFLKICLDAMIVKFADRIDNIEDVWHMKWSKIRKKIRETNTSILMLSKEICSEAYIMLKETISKTIIQKLPSYTKEDVMKLTV